MIGQTLSHYRILEKLGQGGMGEVFLALDTHLNRKLALKFLPEKVRNDPAARTRLVREARTAATLDHPFICKVYEARESDDQAYIAMEYVQGRTLRDRILDGPLQMNELIHVAVEVAEALAVAHEHGIVHRDLKPSNIMLGSNGHVKVMDFGLAKQVFSAEGGRHQDTSLTAPGTIVGTIDYMSPEQLRGQEVDARSDIFSFGTLLGESLTGTHPFRKSSAIETASAILSGAPISLTRPAAAVPSLLNHVIRKALAPDPDDRYQKIQEIISDLRLVRLEGTNEEGRRLAAIMFTDIVGYSAVTQRNEALAMRLLEEHWRLLRPIFPKFEGQEIKTIGDAFLVKFSSTLQAAQCAIEIQRALFERNRTVDKDRRIEIRIGLHLGDVIYRDNDVFGDGVNIASRIQPLAEPGGICISEDVAHQVRNKIEFPLAEVANTPHLKNIDRPVRVFQVALPWAAQPVAADGEITVMEPAGVHPPPPKQSPISAPQVDVGTQASPVPSAAEVSVTAGEISAWRGLRWLPARYSRRWLLGFVSALALVLSLMLGLWLLNPKPVLSFSPRDWILIADFDNETGETLFDRSLDTALSISIEQSQHANVLPKSRIGWALQRMGKQADQKIDEAIGQEICLRENVRGLILPGISKVGQQYVLTARIVDPQTGESVRSYMEEVPAQDAILAKLGELATQIRRDLGESLSAIRVNNRDLMRVTTPSLEALKRYTEGAYLWNKGKFDEAVQLYDSALKIDPDFAKAHNALGIAYSSFVFNDSVRGMEHFKKAISLADRVTERERLTIQIAYEGSLGNTANEVNLARMYLRSYPDDISVRYNLGNVLRDSGRTDEAIVEYQEVLRVAPDFASAYINLATCYTKKENYSEALKSYAKAFDLEPTWLTRGNLNHEYGFTLIEAGKPEEAREIFAKALSTASRQTALRSLALLDLYHGKYNQAKKQLEEALLINVAEKSGLSVARNRLFLSILLNGRGEKKAELQELDEAFKIMQTVPPQLWITSRVGVAYARAGAIAKASQALEKAKKEARTNMADENSEVNRLEGEILLAKGNRAKALELLVLADRQAVDSAFTTESLANAYRIAGETDAAIGEYEELLAHPGRSLGYEPQQNFLAAYYQLARLYQAKGEKEKALKVAEQLLELWKEADPDLPLLRETLKLKEDLRKG